jgi:hypothetical protein
MRLLPKEGRTEVGEMNLKRLKRKIEASDVGAAVKAVEGW